MKMKSKLYIITPIFLNNIKTVKSIYMSKSSLNIKTILFSNRHARSKIYFKSLQYWVEITEFFMFIRV